MTEVKAKDSCFVWDGFAPKTVDIFTLKANGVEVEVSSLGASITKILLPNGSGGTDDVVLGYPTPLEMQESNNPPFLGVVVGRVANRIAKGKFQLHKKEYDLETNNGPNHLHGGTHGFSTRIWGMEIVEIPSTRRPSGETTSTTIPAVRGTLLSADGDEGYPGTVLATATYSLEANQGDANGAATLRLDMTADLQDSQPTPINLAQHTYFNLAKHDAPEGILDHAVRLTCQSYTPKDETNIPTRQVLPVRDTAMDLTSGILMRDALQALAVSRFDLTNEQALQHLSTDERCGPGNMAKSGPNCFQPGEPYGFDHNYVVPQSAAADGLLNRVGSVEHQAAKRRLTIFTNAPGVQVYTGNYLDGINPNPKICKDGAVYGQWQGMCFETQHYPDSILTPQEEEKYPEFAKGKCVILKPGGPQYHHIVQYCFEQME